MRDRRIAQSQLSAQAPSAIAIAQYADLAAVVIADAAYLSISVGLLASIAHGA